MFDNPQEAVDIRNELLRKYDYIEAKVLFDWETQKWYVVFGRAYADILIKLTDLDSVDAVVGLIGIRPKVQEDKTDGLSDSGGFSEPSSSFA